MNNDDILCEERVWEPPHYIHQHTCGRRARYVMRGATAEHTWVVCGTHRRSLLRRGYREVVPNG